MGDPPEVITISRRPWYRGAACIWLGDSLKIEDCHGYCREWEFRWCDEPPEFCEDEG
jgi:hypothetical protein